MKKSAEEQDKFLRVIDNIRETGLGIALYKQNELLWNAAQLEHQPGVTKQQLKAAYQEHNIALRDLLKLICEKENIDSKDLE